MTNELAELLLQRVDIVYLTKGISIADVRYIHIIHNQKMHKGSKGRVKSKLASHMAHTNSIIIYTETFRVRRLSPLTSNSGGGGGGPTVYLHFCSIACHSFCSYYIQ